MKRIYTLLAGLFILSIAGCNSSQDSQNPPMPPAPQDAVMPTPSKENGMPDEAEKNRGDRKEMFEQIRMQKIAFITQELNLTVEESKVFWPVYDNYWDEYMKIQHAQFVANRRISEKASSTEEDIKELSGYFTKYAELISKWSEEFKKVIPVSKVAKVFVAEEHFKNFLIKKGPWKQDRNNNGQMNGQKPMPANGEMQPRGEKQPRGEMQPRRDREPGDKAPKRN